MVDPAEVFTLENPQGQYPVYFPSASHTAAGMMSAADKIKLDMLSPGGAGYDTVEVAAVALPQQSTLNFIGNGISGADNIPNTRTDITIAPTLQNVYSNGAAGPQVVVLDAVRLGIELDALDLRLAVVQTTRGLYLVNPTAADAVNTAQNSPIAMWRGSYWNAGALQSVPLYAWAQMEPEPASAAPGALAFRFNTATFPSIGATINNGDLSDPNFPTGTVYCGSVIVREGTLTGDGHAFAITLNGIKQDIIAVTNTGFDVGGFGQSKMVMGDGTFQLFLGLLNATTDRPLYIVPGHFEYSAYVDDGNTVFGVTTQDNRSGSFNKGLLSISTAAGVLPRLGVNSDPHHACTVFGNFDDVAGTLSGPLIIKGTNEAIAPGSGNYIGLTFDNTAATGGKNWTIFSKDIIGCYNYTDAHYAWVANANGKLKVGVPPNSTDNGYALEICGNVGHTSIFNLYNNQTTAGVGLVYVLGLGQDVASSGAGAQNTTIASYAVATTGLYEVGCVVSVTTGDTVTVQVTYTDGANAAGQTLTIMAAVVIAGNGTAYATAVIRAAAVGSIVVKFTISAQATTLGSAFISRYN